VQANIEENLYSLLFSLLDRAETTFSKIIIAIDDLDKKDTSAVQEILENSLDLFRMGKRRGFIMTGRGFTNLQEAYLTALGIFSEDISLEAMKPKELYQIALNYLNLVRETPQDSPKPFTPEILNQIVNYAHGSPRQLNLICYDVLKQGTALECDKIDAETFPEIWQKVRKKLDFLTPHLRRLMSIIHQAGGIDEDISDRHLDDLGVLTFVELLPELKNLEQEELLIRVEDESGLRFIPSQLYAPPESQE
ncbi:MAG: AAA+ family ATPase, partial [Cyanobacteria bacterium P01_E01_bin.42]